MSQPLSPSHRRFSGRDFTEAELEIIRALLVAEKLSRAQIAQRVCEEFDWRNAAGQLKSMSCRVAMLRMHRAGLITLPAPRGPAPQRHKKPDEGMLLPRRQCDALCRIFHVQKLSVVTVTGPVSSFGFGG